MILPVAPPLEQCDPQEYLFVISTGALCGSAGAVFGIPLERLNAMAQVDITGLDYAPFWELGGPVCWHHEHDKVIGRTTQLHINHEGRHLEVVVRFGQTPLARNVRRSLDQAGRVGERGCWGASIGIQYGVGDSTVDLFQRRITIMRAKLIEWSVVARGADAGAMALGPIVLHVTRR